MRDHLFGVGVGRDGGSFVVRVWEGEGNIFCAGMEEVITFGSIW